MIKGKKSTDIQGKRQGIRLYVPISPDDGRRRVQCVTRWLVLPPKHPYYSNGFLGRDQPMTPAKQIGFTGILLLGLATAATQSLAGNTDKIYKWVDQNGAIQYTQMPPPAGAQILDVKSAPPPADDPAAERARIQQESEALDERMEERREAAAEAESRARN